MLGVASLTLTFLAIWSLVFVVSVSRLQEARSQHELYASFRPQLSDTLSAHPAPIGAPIPIGHAVAVMDVPAIGIHNTVVVEGTTSSTLRTGPGHFRATPLPGQPGTSVLFGRATAYGGPFGRIGSLRSGNTITVTTGQGVFTYRVLDVRHSGDPQLVAPKPGTGRLTLVTASSSGWRAGWAPNDIVSVDAALQGSPQPDPGGRRVTLAADEFAMHGEGGPLLLFYLILQLQLLLAIVVLIAWGVSRWSRWQLWLVSVPVLVAVLWELTTTAARYLPNLL